MSYTLKQCPNMTTFVKDGRIEIDNN
ncbi:hypothetical protein [Sporosarcina sp. P3]